MERARELQLPVRLKEKTAVRGAGGSQQSGQTNLDGGGSRIRVCASLKKGPEDVGSPRQISGASGAVESSVARAILRGGMHGGVGKWDGLRLCTNT